MVINEGGVGDDFIHSRNSDDSWKDLRPAPGHADATAIVQRASPKSVATRQAIIASLNDARHNVFEDMSLVRNVWVHDVEPRP